MVDQIEVRRAAFAEIVDLRHQVLRAGLPRDTAIFAGDELPSTRHYGAFFTQDGKDLTVGCATFHLNRWEDAAAWQLRGMATAPEFRGHGLGRRLLELAESQVLADASSPRVLWANARVPAVGFYELMGWKVVSEVFEIPTAGPHVRILKKL